MATRQNCFLCASSASDLRAGTGTGSSHQENLSEADLQVTNVEVVVNEDDVEFGCGSGRTGTGSDLRDVDDEEDVQILTALCTIFGVNSPSPQRKSVTTSSSSRGVKKIGVHFCAICKNKVTRVEKLEKELCQLKQEIEFQFLLTTTTTNDKFDKDKAGDNDFGGGRPRGDDDDLDRDMDPAVTMTRNQLVLKLKENRVRRTLKTLQNSRSNDGSKPNSSQNQVSHFLHKENQNDKVNLVGVRSRSALALEPKRKSKSSSSSSSVQVMKSVRIQRLDVSKYSKFQCKTEPPSDCDCEESGDDDEPATVPAGIANFANNLAGESEPPEPNFSVNFAETPTSILGLEAEVEIGAHHCELFDESSSGPGPSDSTLRRPQFPLPESSSADLSMILLEEKFVPDTTAEELLLIPSDRVGLDDFDFSVVEPPRPPLQQEVLFTQDEIKIEPADDVNDAHDELTTTTGAGGASTSQWYPVTTPPGFTFFCAVCGAIFETNVALKRHDRTHAKPSSSPTRPPPPPKSRRRPKPAAAARAKIQKSTRRPRRVTKQNAGSLGKNLRGRPKSAKQQAQIPSKCPVCSRVFSNVQNLRRHVQTIHVGQSKFPCPTCPHFKCNSRSKLQDHLATHSNVRDFKCGLCPQAFKMRIHLQVHLRTHTAQKPYECSICGERFAYTSSVRVHEQRFHPEKQKYGCNFCYRRFDRDEHRVAHELNHGRGGARGAARVAAVETDEDDETEDEGADE